MTDFGAATSHAMRVAPGTRVAWAWRPLWVPGSVADDAYIGTDAAVAAAAGHCPGDTKPLVIGSVAEVMEVPAAVVEAVLAIGNKPAISPAAPPSGARPGDASIVAARSALAAALAAATNDSLSPANDAALTSAATVHVHVTAALARALTERKVIFFTNVAGSSDCSGASATDAAAYAAAIAAAFNTGIAAADGGELHIFAVRNAAAAAAAVMGLAAGQRPAAWVAVGVSSSLPSAATTNPDHAAAVAAAFAVAATTAGGPGALGLGYDMGLGLGLAPSPASTAARQLQAVEGALDALACAAAASVAWDPSLGVAGHDGAPLNLASRVVLSAWLAGTLSQEEAVGTFRLDAEAARAALGGGAAAAMRDDVVGCADWRPALRARFAFAHPECMVPPRADFRPPPATNSRSPFNALAACATCYDPALPWLICPPSHPAAAPGADAVLRAHALGEALLAMDDATVVRELRAFAAAMAARAGAATVARVSDAAITDLAAHFDAVAPGVLPLLADVRAGASVAQLAAALDDLAVAVGTAVLGSRQLASVLPVLPALAWAPTAAFPLPHAPVGTSSPRLTFATSILLPCVVQRAGAMAVLALRLAPMLLPVAPVAAATAAGPGPAAFAIAYRPVALVPANDAAVAAARAVSRCLPAWLQPPPRQPPAPQPAPAPSTSMGGTGSGADEGDVLWGTTQAAATAADAASGLSVLSLGDGPTAGLGLGLAALRDDEAPSPTGYKHRGAAPAPSEAHSASPGGRTYAAAMMPPPLTVPTVTSGNGGSATPLAATPSSGSVHSGGAAGIIGTRRTASVSSGPSVSASSVASASPPLPAPGATAGEAARQRSAPGGSAPAPASTLPPSAGTGSKTLTGTVTPPLTGSASGTPTSLSSASSASRLPKGTGGGMFYSTPGPTPRPGSHIPPETLAHLSGASGAPGGGSVSSGSGSGGAGKGSAVSSAPGSPPGGGAGIARAVSTASTASSHSRGKAGPPHVGAGGSGYEEEEDDAGEWHVRSGGAGAAAGAGVTTVARPVRPATAGPAATAAATAAAGTGRRAWSRVPAYLEDGYTMLVTERDIVELFSAAHHKAIATILGSKDTSREAELQVQQSRSAIKAMQTGPRSARVFMLPAIKHEATALFNSGVTHVFVDMVLETAARKDNAAVKYPQLCAHRMWGGAE